MSEEAARSAAEVAVALWDAWQARDWEAARVLLQDAAVLDWPCTEERFEGADAIVEVNRRYPEGWSIAVIRWEPLAEDRVLVLARVDHPPHRFWCNGRVAVEGQQIVHLEEHWATVEAPPAWREGLPGRTRTTPPPEVFLLQEPDLPLLAQERARGQALLQRTVPWAEVYEVGSTAVEGLLTKGDIDWLVRVPLERFAETRRALDRVLPRNPDQLANAVYQGYRVPSPLDMAIQLTVKGGPYDNFLALLERLQGDLSLRAAYNALKQRFDGLPMSDYRVAKGAFIEAALAGSAVL